MPDKHISSRQLNAKLEVGIDDIDVEVTVIIPILCSLFLMDMDIIAQPMFLENRLLYQSE